MKHAIIGAGKIGTALARKFAENNIEADIANSRGPGTLASLKAELGPNITPQTTEEACKADIIYLAVPFNSYQAVAKQFTNWAGKIIVDLTNAFHVNADELGERLSSEVIAQAFRGARLVKGFNHLPAAQLGTSTTSSEEPQVVFLSSNDAAASAAIAKVAGQLGFAPVSLVDWTKAACRYTS